MRIFRYLPLLLLVFWVEGSFGSEQNPKISQRIRRYRTANEYKILKEFFDLLAIPNVSADRKNVRRNAELISAMMEKRGIDSEVLETAANGNPVVYGEIHAPDAENTLLFYVHYDGQPVAPSRWTDSQPFTPVIRKGKLDPVTGVPKPVLLSPELFPLPDDWRIYARSASDDKAPIIALLSAVDALRSEGIPLKNHIKFIFEGEEEAGSVHLEKFLAEHREKLAADMIFLCDGPTYFSGSPTLFFGVRGITSIRLTVFGANVSLHSGHYGNWAPNPVWQLVKLLATMRDNHGRVLIDGFYDTTLPLSATEISALKAVPSYDEKLKKQYGFASHEGGERSLIEAIQQPSLNINGLAGGWVGDQIRTIIPSTATAAIDIRLAKGNDPTDMVQKVVRHIEKQGYHVIHADPDPQTRLAHARLIKVDLPEKGYRASRTPMDHPIAQAVVKTLRRHCDRDVVLLPSLGGSLPIYMFENTLKIPTIGIPIVNFDNNQHQADENLRLGQLWNGIETFAAIFLMDGD
jgi:acetylornithine deacetylase/succinyl-diaminopimelate desuccinylase-like protein